MIIKHWEHLFQFQFYSYQPPPPVDTYYLHDDCRYRHGSRPAPPTWILDTPQLMLALEMLSYPDWWRRDGIQRSRPPSSQLEHHTVNPQLHIQSPISLILYKSATLGTSPSNEVPGLARNFQTGYTKWVIILIWMHMMVLALGLWFS